MPFIKYFLIFLMMISQDSWGQETLSKYLIIDTVIIENDVDLKKLKDDNSSVALLSENKYLTIKENCINNTFPNFHSKIIFTGGYSREISIKIDDKGSVVFLNNLEKLADTIHVRRWVVFHNDLPDSIEISTSYYHRTTDTITQIYKHQESNFISGNTANKKDFPLF